MIQLLTDPDGFLREVKRDGTVLAPLALMVVVGILKGMEQLVYATRAATFDPMVAVDLVIDPTIQVVLWVILATLFFLVSIPFSNGGGYFETLRLVGWGFFPSLLSSVVTLGVAAALVSTSGAEAGSVDAVAAAVQRRGLYRIFESSRAGLVFVLWSIMLWVFGLKHGRELSARAAVVVVVMTAVLVVTLLAAGLATVALLV